MALRRSSSATSGIRLLDEAFHLVRMAPPAAPAAYCLGGVPFVLVLLRFFSDMSRNPFAAERCGEQALLAALAYVWMRAWHAVYAAKLREFVTGRPDPPWTPRRVWRAVTLQAIAAGVTVPLHVLSLVLVFPGPWTAALSGNLVCLGDGSEPRVGPVFRRAMREAGRRVPQNLVLLALWTLVLGLLAIAMAVTLILLPFLLRIFTGVETAYTRVFWAGINTTTLAAGCGIAFLCLDPILTAAYVLRCHYGESLATGEDLLAELAAVRKEREAGGVLGILLLAGVLCLAGTMTATAGEPAPREAAPEVSRVSVSPERMEQALRTAIEKPQYAWRLGRRGAQGSTDREGAVAAMLRRMLARIRSFLEAVDNFLSRLFRWIRRLFPDSRGAAAGGTVQPALRYLLYGLTALLVCGAAVLLVKWLRGRGAGRREALVAQAVAVPDVEDEAVTADRLPADDWLAMATDLALRGDLRLAMRAAYLSCLAFLATRDLLTIARYKSNRDYSLELRRRAHGHPDLLDSFAEAVAAFDRAWYGMHTVDRQQLDRFLTTVRHMRTGIDVA